MAAIGCHVSMAGGGAKAIPRAVERGCECLQIFTTSPRAWKHQTHKAEDVAAFTRGVRERRLGRVFVHASYLLNLGSSDRGLSAKSVALLAETGRWSATLGAAGIVIHTGHCADATMPAGLKRAAKGLKTVLKGLPAGVSLSLEMSAGQTGTIGADFAHFASILDAVDGDPRVSVWLDTAHAFAAGHELRTREGLDALAQAIDRTVTLGRVLGIHANDSKAPLGSRRDRHENIGEGTIGREAFGLLLAHPSFRDLPFVLETPGFDGLGPDRANMDRLKALRAPAASR